MILNTREALKNKLGIMIDGVKSNASSSFLATDPPHPHPAVDDHARRG